VIFIPRGDSFDSSYGDAVIARRRRRQRVLFAFRKYQRRQRRLRGASGVVVAKREKVSQKKASAKAPFDSDLSIIEPSRPALRRRQQIDEVNGGLLYNCRREAHSKLRGALSQINGEAQRSRGKGGRCKLNGFLARINCRINSGFKPKLSLLWPPGVKIFFLSISKRIVINEASVLACHLVEMATRGYSNWPEVET